jgi:ribosomal protein L30E
MSRGRLTAYSKVDIFRFQYTSVNFGAITGSVFRVAEGCINHDG